MAVVTEVGARLVLTGRAGFVSEADLAIRKIEQITLAAQKMGNSFTVAMGKMETATAKAGMGAGAAGAGMGAGAAGAAERDAAAVAAAEASKQRSIAGTVAAGEAAAAKSESNLQRLAANPIIKKTAMWGTGAFALGAYETVKHYGAFQAAIAQSTIDAGLKLKDLPYAQAQMLDISRQTGVSALDVANSLYRVQSSLAGTHATLKDVINTTKDAAKLDVLFNIPKGAATEQTSRIMGSMMYTQLPGAKDPKEIMALINSAVGHGDIRGQDMIAALGKVLPAARSLKLQAPDLFGWIDTLTKSGMQGSQAGTLIRTSMQQLATPSEQGNRAEQMLGIHGGDLKRIMTTEGIPQAIQYLQNAMAKFNPTASFPKTGGGAAGAESAMNQLKSWGILNPGDPVTPEIAAQYEKLGMKVPTDLGADTIKAFTEGTMTKDQQDQVQSALITKVFGGAKGSLPMLALMNDPKAYKELVDSIKKAATPEELAKSMARAMDTPQRQMQISRTNIANTGMDIGKALTPAAVLGFHALESVARYLGDHHAVLFSLAGALAALVTAAVGVSVVSRIAKLTGYFKDLFGGSGSILDRLSGKGGTVAAGAVMETAGATMETAAGTMIVAADTMMAAAGKGAVGGLGGGGGLGRDGLSPYGITYPGTDPAPLPGSKPNTVIGNIKSYTASLLSSLRMVAYSNPEMVGAALSNALLPQNGAMQASDIAAGAKIHPKMKLSAEQVLGYGVDTSHLGKLPTTYAGWAEKQKKDNATNKFNDMIGKIGLGGGIAGDYHDSTYFDNPFGNWQKGRSAPAHGPNRHRGHAPRGGEFGGPDAPMDNRFAGQQFGVVHHKPLPAMTKADTKHVSQINKQEAAATKLGAAAGAFGTATQKHQVAGLIAQRGAQVLTEASKKLHQSADEHKKAAADLKQAGKLHTPAANKLRESGHKLLDAAKQHADAAKSLADSAGKIEAAASKLGNTKIQAAVDVLQLSAALTANAADKGARG